MAKSSSKKKSNKKVIRRQRFIMAGLIALIMLMGGFGIVQHFMKRANAAVIEDENGIKLADYWVEPIADGTGRCILHVETVNDGFEVLACEISCTPDFNESEVHTFGALSQSGATSYTNEVVVLEPGQKLYLRALSENNIYTDVYVVELPDETEEETESETETEVVKTTTVPKATAQSQKTQTAVDAQTQTATDTQTQKTQTAVDATKNVKTEDTTKKTAVSTDQKNTTIINETIVNKRIIDEEVVNPVREMGYVYVNYISEDGRKLSSVDMSGTVGTDFSTEQRKFTGYEFINVTGNTSGKFSKSVQNVTYVYRLIATTEKPTVEEGTVNVSYEMEDGSVLASTSITGVVGASYETEQKDFDNCEFVEVRGCVAGVISKESVNVVYVYRLVATEETHVHDYKVMAHAEAKCLTDGYTTYQCECGDEYTETESAHGHSMKVYAVTESGIESHCMECGHIDVVESDSVVEDEDYTENTESDEYIEALDEYVETEETCESESTGDVIIDVENYEITTVETSAA